MRTYRMETPGGGSNYHPVEDAVNGDWVHVDAASEVIGSLKTQLCLANDTIEELRRQLEPIGVGQTNRQVSISMSNREYDRMRKALGREWEWNDVIITVPVGK